MSEENTKENGAYLGVIMGFATLFGYLCTYAHQAGYYSYYAIPLDWIEMSLTSIVSVVGTKGVVWFIVFSAVYRLFDYFEERKWQLLGNLIFSSVVAFIMALVFWPMSFIAFFAGFVWALIFSVVMIAIDKVRDWKRQKKDQVETSTRSKDEDYTEHLFGRYGAQVFGITYFCSIFVAALYGTGRAEAAAKREYYVVEEPVQPRETIVIKSRPDFLICAMVEDEIILRIVLVPIGENQRISLRRKRFTEVVSPASDKLFLLDYLLQKKQSSSSE